MSVSKDDTEVLLGKVFFQGKKIPFAHMIESASSDRMLRVMFKEWKLKPPKIVLIMINDQGSLTSWSDLKLKEAFIKGLTKACNATSMWIFTAGYNIGTSKVIGDAFQENYSKRYAQLCYGRLSQKINFERTPLIGVCHEHFLTYSEKFKYQENDIELENKGNRLEDHKFDLNPYHTHYWILRQRVKLLPFLTRLEEGFKGFPRTENDEENVIWPISPVPAVAILVHGNLNDVDYILMHLKKKLPILIIKGSGGLADIMAYAYYEVHRSFLKINDIEYVENVLKHNLCNEIMAAFPTVREKLALSSKSSSILECIKCAEPPDLKYITIFNMLDSSWGADDLPNYLLETVLKSQKHDASDYKEQLQRDLQLTIDFNSPELAETKVFFKDPDFVVPHDVFQQTLYQNGREKFISMFLDHGFKVQKFTNSSRVIKLFEKVLKENFFREVCWESVLGYKKMMIVDENFIDADLNWIIETLNGIPINITARELENFSLGIYPPDYPEDIASDKARRKSMIVLIIWALLSNRAKLALCLWRHIDRPVISALACSMMLNNVQEHVKDKNMIKELQEVSCKFADMALGVFDLCYKDMPSKAYNSLCVESKEWGNHSIIAMAAFAHNKNLVAHSCCQKWLTSRFLGNVKVIDCNRGFMTFPEHIKVILCAFLIFPMYWWVRFKDSSAHGLMDTNEYETAEPYNLPSFKEKKKKLAPTKIERTNLLKYTYPPLTEMIHSMWSAPITRFWVSLIFYIIYLIIFSVAVIWPSCGNYHLDLLVCIWTFLIAVESIHCLYAIKQVHPTTKLFSSCLEIVYILLFAASVAALRIGHWKNPYGGKVLMCIGLIWFYYRMIFIYLPISPTLGPLLQRVKEMVSVDFVNFFKFVFLILIANAIAMQAVLYPDYPLSYELFRMAFHKAFISFFKTPVGELKGTEKNCVKYEQNPNDQQICRVSEYIDGRCSSGTHFWPYVIVFHYMLLLKLVLLTILFALFHATGARIGPESNILWKHQRYHLVQKFSVSMRLPPPLNVLSVLQMIVEGINQLFSKGLTGIYNKEEAPQTHSRLSSFENNYWKQLSQAYISEKDIFADEGEFIEKEVETINQMLADVNMKNNMLFRAKSQIAQLEADFSYTQAHLETLKYREKKEEEMKTGFTLHTLSRDSPYTGTNIQRFPVPDKYVPWEVLGLHYDPSTYSAPKMRLPLQLRSHADDINITKDAAVDVESKRNAYAWNRETKDESGGYKSRQSWCLDIKGNPLLYQLQDGLPCNPMGRTGLRGKGLLPRWGPNHNIFVVITRQKQKTPLGSHHFLLGSTSGWSKILEVVKCTTSKMEWSLPGGYSWLECSYSVIQNVFTSSDSPWKTSDHMIEFFKRFSAIQSDDADVEDNFISKMVYRGYMDDELNTDNAWKEVELWHIHYRDFSSIDSVFKGNTSWRMLSDDFFLRMPSGQTTLLKYVIKSMEH